MRLTGWTLPVEHLSATSIFTANLCPEQWRQKYLVKAPSVSSGDAFVGSVFHRAIQGMFTGEQADGAIDRVWNEIIDKEGEPDWRDEDPVAMFKRTKKMLDAYAPYVLAEEPIAVEQRFDDVIGGVPVVGYVDREMSNRILEVKTNSQRVSKPKVRHLFQGRLYSLVSDKPIEWNYVTRQVTPQVLTAETVPELFVDNFNKDTTVKIVKDTVEMLSDFYQRYGADNHWPLHGAFHDWACGYCEFRRICPIGK